jgi:hypothetical protein
MLHVNWYDSRDKPCGRCRPLARASYEDGRRDRNPFVEHFAAPATQPWDRPDAQGPGIDKRRGPQAEAGSGMSRVSKFVRSTPVALSLAVVPLSNAGSALAVTPAEHVYVQKDAAASNGVVAGARGAHGARRGAETPPPRPRPPGRARGGG